MAAIGGAAAAVLHGEGDHQEEDRRRQQHDQHGEGERQPVELGAVGRRFVRPERQRAHLAIRRSRRRANPIQAKPTSTVAPPATRSSVQISGP